jgi:multisubunit Na+/H+ antiporter MnhF subunit
MTTIDLIAAVITVTLYITVYSTTVRDRVLGTLTLGFVLVLMAIGPAARYLSI